jgi:cation diffusion facilitator family transporter
MDTTPASQPTPGRRAGHDHDHHGHDHGHAGGLAGLVRSILRPHRHDSADSSDAALESSADGIRAVKLSLVGLGVTAVLQALVVWVSGSVALLADTLHNLSDALTALPLWVAFVVGRRAASNRYTYGYGRAEDLAGILIVAMIALSAMVTGWQSLRRLADPVPIQSVGLVIAAGLIGFAGNEGVAVYRLRVGRRIGSAALVADGLHARSDGLTSLAVVLGGLGVALGLPLADPVVGLLITVAILFVLRSALRDIYRRLMDAVDPGLVEQAERVLSETPGVVGVDAVRLRWIGHRLHAEVAVVVDNDLMLVAAHDIAEEARHRMLHELPKLRNAIVHVSPLSDELDHHDAVAHHGTAGPH